MTAADSNNRLQIYLADGDVIFFSRHGWKFTKSDALSLACMTCLSLDLHPTEIVQEMAGTAGSVPDSWRDAYKGINRIIPAVYASGIVLTDMGQVLDRRQAANMVAYILLSLLVKKKDFDAVIREFLSKVREMAPRPKAETVEESDSEAKMRLDEASEQKGNVPSQESAVADTQPAPQTESTTQKDV